jgi:superfamily II DNA or RNA helicase
MLRKHQRDFSRIIDNIIAGAPTRTILVRVCPGGGKSALPIIAGRLITAGLADAMCWVVPRMSLQDQGERNFQDPFFRRLLNHNLAIRTSTNEPNPCRGLNGFVTTYQALGMPSGKLVWEEFKRRRYILVLDEFHHVEENGVWHNALQPLVDEAAYLVLMTGTIERGDGKAIAFIPYGDDGAGGLAPVVTESEEMAVVEYGRQIALEEKAILPLYFRLSDGAVSWKKDGHEYSVDSLAEANRLWAGAAIMTALNTDLGMSILDDAVSSWRDERGKGHTSASLLVVTATYDHAKRVHCYLRDERGISNADIATSHNPEQAVTAIRKFKRGKTEILVTIAMAYEGMDVPSISHIACLTHIRSVPWIEQMCARAVRIDPDGGDYLDQRAHIFAPDDLLFRAVVDRIEREQLPVVKAREPQVQCGLFDGEGSKRPKITFLESTFIGTREIVLGGAEHIKTPTEIQRELLRRIESHVRRYAFDNVYDVRRLNAEIKGVFGKARREMTNTELVRVQEYVQAAYPLGYGITAEIESTSAPRAKRPRVPTKAVPWPI